MKLLAGVAICLFLLGTTATAQSITVPNDPATSASCFAQYMPVLTSIANNYHIQYQQCITAANNQTAALTQRAHLIQQQLTQQTAVVCNEYQACQADTSVLNFYNCYAAASNLDVTIVYGVGQNATAEATDYTQSLEQITFNQDLCTNATQNTYVTDTAITYRLLNQCLESSVATITANTAAGSVASVALGTPATAADAAVKGLDVDVATPTNNEKHVSNTFNSKIEKIVRGHNG